MQDLAPKGLRIKNVSGPLGDQTRFLSAWESSLNICCNFLQTFYCHGKILEAADTDDPFLRNRKGLPADALAQTAAHQQYGSI